MGARHFRLRVLAVPMILVLSTCGTAQDDGNVSSEARPVELPGAAENIDFDDIVYSSQLERMLVPARESGLYLVEPDSGTARRVEHPGSADSADEGRGLLFVADRAARTITVVDPADGRELSSVSTGAAPDYVRYSSSTGELLVAEPEGSPRASRSSPLRAPHQRCATSPSSPCPRARRD